MPATLWLWLIRWCAPHLCLLGGFDFAVTQPPIPAFSRKARAMVAYLALQSGHSQSREKLAALLWGGNSEPQARMSLRQALSAVRKAMQSSEGGKFLTDGDNIALHLDGLDFDVARFEELAAGPAPGATRTGARRLSWRPARWLRPEGGAFRGLAADRARAVEGDGCRGAGEARRALFRDERSCLMRARGNAPAGHGAAEGGHPPSLDASLCGPGPHQPRPEAI